MIGSASARCSPRPHAVPRVRKYTFEGNFNYIENARAGFVESRDAGGRFQIDVLDRWSHLSNRGLAIKVEPTAPVLSPLDPWSDSAFLERLT